MTTPRLFLGVFAMVLILPLLLLACGGPSVPTEENLKARAEAHGVAMVDGDYSEVYEFATPRCKATYSKDSYLASANADLMSAATSMGLDEDAKPKTVVRTKMGVDEDANLEVRVSDVEVTGNRGSALVESFLDGLWIGSDGGDNFFWVFEDGQWFNERVITSEC